MRRGWAFLIGVTALVGCGTADQPSSLSEEPPLSTTTVVPPSTSTPGASATSPSAEAPTTPAPASTTRTPTTTAPPETVLDGGDPFLILVDELPVEVAVFQTADEVVVARTGSAETVPVPITEWAWSDGDFVYETFGWPDPVSRAYDLAGSLVCEAEGRVLHVTRRQDGGYVMASESVIDWSDQVLEFPQPVPLDAVDCETGERQPIEPLSFLDTEIGSRFIERIGGREFRGEYDAEGNADIVNEQGISVNGDDYAGYHAFAADGSLVAYGDMGLGAGPHVSTTIRMRDTTTGTLLWSAELPRPFASLHVVDAGVLATLVRSDPIGTGDWTTDAVLVLDRDDGTPVSTHQLPARLVYAGP